mmetsp:Transcript_93661/g.195318  ORF Transcript_93661/g.195318 Transcript_93661/m.195318 type:complete len:1039 (-) Transcript_93661:19-3135(-)
MPQAKQTPRHQHKHSDRARHSSRIIQALWPDASMFAIQKMKAAPAGDMETYCRPGGPKMFAVGDQVEALWSHDDSVWYRAEVTSVNTDGTYGLLYTGGRTDVGVPAKWIRHLNGFEEKAWVEAKWLGGDTWYVAQIVGVNEDGTYNVFYRDDGITEDNVSPDFIRSADQSIGPDAPTDGDAVCDVHAAVADSSAIVDEAESEVDAYAEHELGHPLTMKKDLANLGPPSYGVEDSAADSMGVGAPAAAPSPAAAGPSTTVDATATAAATTVALPTTTAVPPTTTTAAAAAGATPEGGEAPAGFQPVAPGKNGGCRLSVGARLGPEHKKELSPVDCSQACAIASDCAAYEVGPGSHCDIHHQPVVEVDHRSEYKCFRKDPTTLGAGAAGGIGGEVSDHSLEMQALQQRIKAQRAEIVARTRELLARAKASGASPGELEELEDLLAQDLARLEQATPSTLEEATKETERLSIVIADRAARLERQLHKEKDLVKGKTKLRKPDEHDRKMLVDKIKNKRDHLKGALDDLRKKEERLAAEGKLDPELQQEIDQAKEVLENSLSGLASLEKSILDPNGFSQQAWKQLKGELGSAKAWLAGFGLNVVPHGSKWWRYRWEYSYVESTIICLLCLIAACWQKAHDMFHAWIGRHVYETPTYLGDLKPNLVLAAWTRHFWGEMLVLLLTVMTLWILARLRFFVPWMRFHFWLTSRSINMPTEEEVYVSLSRDVAMQLIVSVMVFFSLALNVCYRAVKNDRDCRRLENSEDDALEMEPVAPNMIGRWAQTPEEFGELKQSWLEGVLYRSTGTPRERPEGAPSAQMVSLALDERGVLSDGNHNAFPLHSFLSHRVRHGVQRAFSVDSITWLCCSSTFFVFAFLHYTAQIAYIRLSLALSVLSVGAFGYMVYTLSNMHQWSLTEDTFLVRMPPLAVVDLFQFPLFFLCFCTVRLTVSVWMWTFFLKLAIFFTLLMIAFGVAFSLYISPTIVAFLIKTSFPPFTDGTENLVREVMDDYEIIKMRQELRKGAQRAFSPRTGEGKGGPAHGPMVV